MFSRELRNGALILAALVDGPKLQSITFEEDYVVFDIRGTLSHEDVYTLEAFGWRVREYTNNTLCQFDLDVDGLEGALSLFNIK